MNPFSFFFNEVLYRPLLNGLVWFYTVLPWHDLGLSIILLTIVIRLILLPLLWSGQRTQKRLAQLQPEIKKLQEQFKNNKEAQGKALMELYAKHKVNPFSGCLSLIVQLPILFMLLRVFQRVTDPSQMALLYSFVHNPGILSPISFKILDLSHGNIYLGVIAALAQYYQAKLMMPSTPVSSGKNDFASILQKQSLYLFPVIILVWSFKLPSALTLYWTVLSVFGILQELISRRFEDSSPLIMEEKNIGKK